MAVMSAPLATAQRVEQLSTYMSERVLSSDGFCCTKADSCRSAALFRRDGTRYDDRFFYAAQMPHVGEHYDISEDGKPWRVLLVGMEVGRPPENITLSERRDQQNQAIKTDFRKRETHMRGTTSALRAAFGHPVGVDREGELLFLDNEAEPKHVMQCYALTNARLCSAVSAGSSSKAPDTMTENCLEHLAATVRILEPNLVVLQSKKLRSAILPRLRDIELIDPQLRELEYAEFAGIDTLIVSLPHPRQYGPNQHMAWGLPDPTPFLTETVVPTIAAARSFGLGT